jgi:hypothetical protein
MIKYRGKKLRQSRRTSAKMKVCRLENKINVEVYEDVENI